MRVALYMLNNYYEQTYKHICILFKFSTLRWNSAPFQYENSLSRYVDFHYKEKMVVRLSYLYNGNSHTGKTTSLYWNGPQIPANRKCPHLHTQYHVLAYCQLHPQKQILLTFQGSGFEISFANLWQLSFPHQCVVDTITVKSHPSM